MRTAWVGALVAVAAALVAVAAKSWCGIPAPDAADLYLRWCYSDVPPLYVAERLDAGAVPYVDHPVEYPVLTGLWMWLAAAPTSTIRGYVGVTWALLVGSAAGTAWLLGREVGWPRVLGFAAAPTLLISGAVNWDLPSVLLATAGLVAHRRGRDVAAGVWLGLGTAAKLWPALLLPGVLIGAWGARGRDGAGRSLLGAAGAWLAVNVPVLVVAPQGWARFLELSRERPADWDALWRLAGTGWPTPTLNLVIAAVFGIGALALLARAAADPPHAAHLVALPIVAWFLVTGKVYSPQFTLWLLPLLVLAWPGWGWWAALALADVAVTATRFPYLAGVLGIEGAWSQGPFAAAVVVRAVVLLAVAGIGWRRAVAERDTVLAA